MTDPIARPLAPHGVSTIPDEKTRTTTPHDTTPRGINPFRAQMFSSRSCASEPPPPGAPPFPPPFSSLCQAFVLQRALASCSHSSWWSRSRCSTTASDAQSPLPGLVQKYRGSRAQSLHPWCTPRFASVIPPVAAASESSRKGGSIVDQTGQRQTRKKNTGGGRRRSQKKKGKVALELEEDRSIAQTKPTFPKLNETKPEKMGNGV